MAEEGAEEQRAPMPEGGDDRPAPQGEEDAPKTAADEEKDIAEAIKVLVRSGMAEELKSLPTTADLAHKDKKQDIDLKGAYGIALLVLLTAQVVAANWIFVRYAQAAHWNIDSDVMKVWLVTTLGEVVGVVTVVVRYLFPRRDK